MSSTTHQRPPGADEQPYRRALLIDVFRLLASNGDNARSAFDMYGKSFPDGGVRELINTHPVYAVRAEVAGTTLTVEITSQRRGEIDQPDALWFCCDNLRDFEQWFTRMLQNSGLSMKPAAPLKTPVVQTFIRVAYAYQSGTYQPTSRPAAVIRPDLRPAPMFHRKRRRR